MQDTLKGGFIHTHPDGLTCVSFGDTVGINRVVFLLTPISERPFPVLRLLEGNKPLRSGRPVRLGPCKSRSKVETPSHSTFVSLIVPKV